MIKQNDKSFSTKIVLFTGLFFISATFGGYCETIRLKNGKTVHEKIIERTDEYIKVDYSGIPITYYLDEIKSINGVSTAKEPNNTISTTSGFNQAMEMHRLTSDVFDDGSAHLTYFADKDGREYIITSDGADDESKPWRSGSDNYRDGNFDGALRDFNKAVTMGPNSAGAYVNRGIAYQKLGDFDSAFADYNKAISIDPNLAYAYLNRGSAYYRLGKLDNAFADFNKTISIDPNFARAYLNRGLIYQTLGDLDSALADLNKGLSINPNIAGAYISRGLIYQELGDFDSAVNDYHKAQRLGYNLPPEIMEKLREATGR